MILLLVSYKLGACFNPDEFFSQYIPDWSQRLIRYFFGKPIWIIVYAWISKRTENYLYCVLIMIFYDPISFIFFVVIVIGLAYFAFVKLPSIFFVDFSVFSN